MSGSPAADEKWTVGKLLTWTVQFFQDKQVEGGRLAAELLLARALGCRKIELYTRYETEPSAAQRDAFRDLVRKAADHSPIAYLLGYREFFSLDFEVTPAVLIPRPETEVLVQRAIEICRDAPERRWQVLDVGTGSGCIAVSLAKLVGNVRIVASDVSPEALDVARRNAEKHEVGERVICVEADAVDLPREVMPDGGFDVIVSNPPYISEAHWATLPPHIREHEPAIALTGPGGDGLALYRVLAERAGEVLTPNGTILVEFGFDQRDAVRGIFENAGGWTYVNTHRDPTDPHDRAMEFQRA